MRVVFICVWLMLFASPSVATAQAFVIQGAAGPTLVDQGYSFSAGAGITPTRHLGILFDVERVHLSSQSSSDGRGGSSSFRGGALTLGSAQLRVAPLGHDRIGPYGLAGFAAGVSRPTVNEVFTHRVTNDVLAMFFGAGILMPLKDGLNAVVDARMFVGNEEGELFTVLPVRAGLAWRF